MTEKWIGGDYVPGSAGLDNPKLEMTFGDRTFDLTWENTWLCLFMVGNGNFDHVMHRLPNGYVVGIELGNLDANTIRQTLLRFQFPFRLEPTLDQLTIDGLVRVHGAELETELDDLPPAD